MMALTVVRCTGQVNYRLSLHWYLSDVFVMARLGLGFQRARNRGEEPFSQPHIKGKCYQRDYDF